MTRINKLLIGLVAGLISLAVAALVFIETALSPTCVNTIIKASENSSHEFVAVLFERNCGATTGFSTQVSIIHAGQELPGEVGNIYIADGYPEHNGLTWISTKTLHIGGARYDAYKREEKFMGVKITYE